ncbi:hypothetical protein UAJ10_09265 [Nitrospirillum sp. BR 11164]|uniref:hypothetical protein n=1 Tax=Nitrospirillum sp. BR 11164 TaxID=3104324 RepID=UPI002AFF4D02|nr:hypothetical protein [Nitrospirillum sp. BR 11164]MEA1649206.1 hypothetical protein [Nitrospirillum sp. BR 11164]
MDMSKAVQVPVGYRSSTARLTAQDGRSRNARFLRDIRAELTAHVGTPTAPQRMLIDLIAATALRLLLLSEKIGTDAAPCETDHRYWTVYANSLARSLDKLGLHATPGKAPTLKDVLSGRGVAA